MKMPVEDFVPYDRSARWLLHDAYYRMCGPRAWNDGNIPSPASSDYAFARQHGEMMIGVVTELEKTKVLGPTDVVWLLEIGAGDGLFAASLLRALESGLGEAGTRLFRRLRYVMSDMSLQTLKAAESSRPLRDHVATGRLIPALFDLRDPGELTDLNGAPLAAQFSVVIANYVCSASPIRVFRREADGYSEKYVRTSVEVPGEHADVALAARAIFAEIVADPLAEGLLAKYAVASEWRPASLAAVFPRGVHAAVIDRTIGAHEGAILSYPHTFVDMLATLRKRVVHGALVLVNDHGTTNDDDFKHRTLREPPKQGNVLDHTVQMRVFDAAAPRIGYSLLRTTDPLRSVHTIAMRASSRLSEPFRKAFTRTYAERNDCDDLRDLRSSAWRAFLAKDYMTAARLYKRALALDPEDRELLFRGGEAALEGSAYGWALELLSKGASLDAHAEWDFEFQLGRLLHRRRRREEALRAYARSLAREQHPQTHVNMGRIREELGDITGAIDCYRAALAIDPRHTVARERAEVLAKSWLGPAQAIDAPDEQHRATSAPVLLKPIRATPQADATNGTWHDAWASLPDLPEINALPRVAMSLLRDGAQIFPGVFTAAQIVPLYEQVLKHHKRVVWEKAKFSDDPVVVVERQWLFSQQVAALELVIGKHARDAGEIMNRFIEQQGWARPRRQLLPGLLLVPWGAVPQIFHRDYDFAGHWARQEDPALLTEPCQMFEVFANMTPTRIFMVVIQGSHLEEAGGRPVMLPMEPGDVIAFDHRTAHIGAAYRRPPPDGDPAMPPILRLTMSNVYVPGSRFGKALADKYDEVLMAENTSGYIGDASTEQWFGRAALQGFPFDLIGARAPEVPPLPDLAVGVPPDATRR